MIFFDNLIVFPVLESKFLIQKVHNLLCSIGASPSIGDLYHLNDYNGKETDPIVIEEKEKVIQQLINWPTGGWITYDIQGGDLLVSYITAADHFVHVISISEQRANERDYNSKAVEQLILKIGDLVNAQYILRGESILSNDNKAIKTILNI